MTSRNVTTRGHPGLKVPGTVADVSVTMNITRIDILSALLPALLLTAPHAASAADHAHDAVDCNSCHELGATQRTRTLSRCVACHAPGQEKPWGSTAFHAQNPKDCVSCHGFHDTSQVRLPGDAGSIPLAELVRYDELMASAPPSVCQPCHRTDRPDTFGLTAAHEAAGAWYHANPTAVINQSVSQSCLRCHDASQELPEEIGESWSPPRPHVAASHPFEVPVTGRHGSLADPDEIDPRLELVDGLIECTTCHDLYRNENDMLVEFETRKDLCLGCHEHIASPGPGGRVAVAR